MLLKICVFFILLHGTASLMCYQCADSSSDKGKNRCQTYVRTMRYYSKRFRETGHLNKYSKNCSEFKSTPESPVYCMVAAVELGGGIKSYIRDCSDGKNFFSADYNTEFGEILPDNQTQCAYTGQGYIACVTLCGGDQFGTKYGDFCNGPIPGKAVTIRGSLIMFLLALLPFITANV